MSAVTRSNTIECGNVLAESTFVTFDDDIILLGNITFNTIPIENDVLKFTNGSWQKDVTSSAGGNVFSGNLDITNGGTLYVGNICGVTLDWNQTDITNISLIEFVNGGAVIGNVSTTIASGTTAIAIGVEAEALSGNTIAIGSSASATQPNAIALGYNIVAGQSGGFFVKHRGPGAYTTNAAGFISGTNELVEVTSSRRFKENIRDLEEVSSIFDLFRPVRYQAKPGYGDDREHIGLIAEEVAEIFPEFVTYDQNGEVTGIMLDRIIAVTIKEIQALRARREIRRERILKLQSQINS